MRHAVQRFGTGELTVRISWQFFVRLRRKQDCAGQQCRSPTWLVGRGGITEHNIILVGLIHVSLDYHSTKVGRANNGDSHRSLLYYIINSHRM
jgi:hypothetical protein